MVVVTSLCAAMASGDSWAESNVKYSSATIYVPDNYPTIQQAVDFAITGDTIIVRDGTYPENVDVNVTNLTIKSENGSANCIVNASNSNDPVFKITADYVNISEFTVENATGDYAAGIYLYDVEHCNISNNIVSNTGLGIYLNATYNSVIDNNIVSDSGAGIGLENSTYSNVTNNKVNNTNWAIDLWSSHFNRVIDNTIFNTTGIEAPPYGTLGWAINVMDSSGNLIDNNHVYNTTASGDDANAVGICVMAYTAPASNNTITNNEIYNTTASGENASAMGICVMGGPTNNNTIANNELYNATASGGGQTAGFGIYVMNAIGNKLLNNTISSNDVGIMLHNSPDNLIRENYVGPNDHVGIRIYLSNNNTLSNNTAFDNTNGINMGWSNNNTVFNNTVYNSTYHGIWLTSASNNNLVSNTAFDNENGIGLNSSSCDNRLSDNKAYNNTYNGVTLDSSSNKNTLVNNTVYNNPDKGIYLDSSNNNLIYNNFFNNMNNAYDDGTNIWNISKTAGTNIIGGQYLGGNYWNDYAGIDMDGDGLGDTLLPYNSSGNIANGGDWLPLVKSEPSVFDTEPPDNPYPSISGTHNGTITPSSTINVSTLYTYPCVGTGGHTNYAKIWNPSWVGAEAHWNGYVEDWNNISFDKTFTLYENETYNYTIKTGSYPQIIHEPSKDVTGGTITCTSFVDANGKVHTDWIPAIKLF
jgi:parallel beta-helix repeat protein